MFRLLKALKELARWVKVEDVHPDVTPSLVLSDPYDPEGNRVVFNGTEVLMEGKNATIRMFGGGGAIKIDTSSTPFTRSMDKHIASLGRLDPNKTLSGVSISCDGIRLRVNPRGIFLDTGTGPLITLVRRFG